MKNRNPGINKSGLKGSFPKMGGGSVSTGLSGRKSIDTSAEIAFTDRRGPNQLPAKSPTVPWKGK